MDTEKQERACPRCGDSDPMRVLYMGLPMWACRDDSGCGTVWGFWSWVLAFGFNGVFLVIPDGGSYWKALWVWLRSG